MAKKDNPDRAYKIGDKWVDKKGMPVPAKVESKPNPNQTELFPKEEATPKKN